MKQAQINSIFPAAKHSQQLTQDNTINLTAAMAAATDSKHVTVDSKKTAASTKQKVKCAMKQSFKGVAAGSGKNTGRKTGIVVSNDAQSGAGAAKMLGSPSTQPQPISKTQKTITAAANREDEVGLGGSLTAAADTLSLNSAGSSSIAVATSKRLGGAAREVTTAASSGNLSRPTTTTKVAKNKKNVSSSKQSSAAKKRQVKGK